MAWFPLILALLLLMVPSTPWRAAAGEPPAEPGPHESTVDVDRPGSAARPVAGAPAAPAVRRGTAVSIQVNVDAGGANIVGDAANEPSIAVDPNQPQRMAIGWRQFDTVTSSFREAGVAWSSDGGRSWTASTLDPNVFRSDPVLSSDAAGNFQYYSLALVGQQLLGAVFVSTDGGRSWSPPRPAPTGDKPWTAVDVTGGAGAGNYYVLWSKALACCGDSTFVRSPDAGFSWSPPAIVPHSPAWGTMTVDADGVLYLVGWSSGALVVVRSTDARSASGPPTFESPVTVDLGGELSAFGGLSSPNPDGLFGQAWIVAGPAPGQLYVLASVDPPGPDPLDVRFARSTDGGLSWEPSVRIHEDGANAWQWFGTLSVAPGGRLDAVWNDTRASGVPRQSELIYASSHDGGITWSAAEVLSPMWDSHVGWPGQNKIGDYYHMVSDDVGAHLAWSATFRGEQDIYYLRIGDYDCNRNGVGDAQDIAGGFSLDLDGNTIPDECEGAVTSAVGSPTMTRLHPNAPNPFNPRTVIRFEVRAGGARVRLEVFDVAGRRIRVLEDARLEAGSHVRAWDGRDGEGRPVVSGQYYYRLQTPRGDWTRKMQLVK